MCTKTRGICIYVVRIRNPPCIVRIVNMFIETHMCVHIYTCLSYEVAGNPDISESENIALGRLAVLVEPGQHFFLANGNK